MKQRQDIRQTRRWVIKIGSTLLTDEGRGLDKEAIAVWVDQMAALRQDGVELVLVSSGAVVEGCTRLKWSARPRALHDLQAAAAVGQMGLIQSYESNFQRHAMHTAQVLLTHDDLKHRQRYLNARSTLRTLLDLGVVPVVNENDTVVTDEIRFGDNDTLAALAANLVEAELLVILTDQDGMFDSDPRTNPDAKLLDIADAADSSLLGMAGSGGSGLGRGGMTTKVLAAQRAARSGTATIIANGRTENVLMRIRAGADGVGTLFTPSEEPLAARKQWLASHLQSSGRLVLDDGAVQVLRSSGKSLLAVGVQSVVGDFQRGQLVVCIDLSGAEIAKGLVNYSADETRKIMGQPSRSIEGILGYIDEPELIHRDNLAVL